MTDLSRRGLFTLLGGVGVIAAVPTAAMAIPMMVPTSPDGTVHATVLWWNGRMGHVRGDDNRRYAIDSAHLTAGKELRVGERIQLKVRTTDSHSVIQIENL